MRILNNSKCSKKFLFTSTIKSKFLFTDSGVVLIFLFGNRLFAVEKINKNKFQFFVTETRRYLHVVSLIDRKWVPSQIGHIILLLVEKHFCKCTVPLMKIIKLLTTTIYYLWVVASVITLL